VHLLQVLIPNVHPGERLLFTHTTLPGCYRAVVRYGYRDEILHDDLFLQKLSAQVMHVVCICASVCHINTSSCKKDSAVRTR